MTVKCEKTLKTYYDALEEGKILGRKCKKCGHIEYPPYPSCNKCGCFDTEWVEISGKAYVTQLIPSASIYADQGFEKRHGRNYMLGGVRPEGSDETVAPIMGINAKDAEALQDKLPLPVKPVILQEDGYKIVAWELVDQLTE